MCMQTALIKRCLLAVVKDYFHKNDNFVLTRYVVITNFEQTSMDSNRTPEI